MTDLYKPFSTQIKECIKEGNCNEVKSEPYNRGYPANIMWCKKYNIQCMSGVCLDKRVRGINPRTGKKEKGKK